ncbi:MAG: transcription-repair coupling factor, partial [Phycisphaerae bacterium]
MLVIPQIASDSNVRRLTKICAELSGVVHVGGLWGSCAPMVTALIVGAIRRPCLYVTAHLEQADHVRDDLELFGGHRCELFPAWESLPGEAGSSGEISAERLRLCTGLSSRPSERNGTASPEDDASAAPFIVAPIQALMQPVPSPSLLERNTLRLHAGRAPGAGVIGPEALLAWAVERGFERLELVESPGDVARRGDIVDLFAPGEAQPYRIQFFEDEVEAIRRFDVGTQRSTESLPSMAVAGFPDPHWMRGQDASSLGRYLPADTLVVLDEPGELQQMGATLLARTAESHALADVNVVLAAMEPFGRLHLSALGPAATADEAVIDLGVTSVARFETTAEQAVAELCDAARDQTVYVICDTEGERQRLREMIAEQSPDAPPSLHVQVGTLHRGFHWTRGGVLVIAHHEIFHRHRQRRRIRRVHASRPLESWLDLRPGDYVVHVAHGIAVFRGLRQMRKGDSNQQEEFLRLEFADQAFVYVPSSQVDLVQKYIGAGGRRPKLSTIGGKRWSKAKKRVADAVGELAESLLRVQALREAAVGTAYPQDTQWQREFEASFPYEETEDQLIVAGEIRSDLTRPRPMDRLVCGDVGYGKTELAMRAVFKVVEYGRQAAVLVPTTVLAEQHYATFQERMAEYPFSIACLSRFRGPAEQKRIVQQLRKGQIDVVIGTHRLVSADVRFADLGLVVIDEEQRFGVEHKEKLRALRETVDVLTLSATPIPRTLHMALMGIRDISSLQTPPVDRRSIVTRLGPFNEDLVRNAILREMNRDGQVYFLHNAVRSIAAMTDRIRGLVPEARVVYAHGQMKGGALEAVMHRFIRREADVLVCTTIIESGVDIPTVNTIFIDRAERFGLADLHQLRGRVGRSSHRAYCYLLLSDQRPPTPKAARRLKTIEEFSELGAGFRIAMRDLEIRGAGNLLGADQSGHIAVVGYEMYCRLLERTVRRLKNEPEDDAPPVQIDLDVTARIPADYIQADRSRIEVYRRVVSCRTQEDLARLQADVADAYGPPPGEVQRLLDLAEIRVAARRFGIKAITLRPPDVVFSVPSCAGVGSLFADAPGSVRMADARTIHLRLPPAYLEPPTLLAVLRKMLTTATIPVEAV